LNYAIHGYNSTLISPLVWQRHTLVIALWVKLAALSEVLSYAKITYKN